MTENNHQPANPEERIVAATIACIEQYGIAGATNRRIAEQAEVNIAAINYYFRSKEALIRRCLEITLQNAFEMNDMPPMPEASAQERCIAVVLDLLEGGQRYPGISRAHFYNLVTEGPYDRLLAERLNRFIADLSRDLRPRSGALPAEELTIALIQIMSAAIFAILAPALYTAQYGVNLNDPATRQVYARRLVAGLLAPSTAERVS
jgi:AcrR family transcriptional regulator